MGRPHKAEEEKYVGRQIKFPRTLWTAVEQQIPYRERSAFVRRAIEDALLRRAAEAAHHYYSTDPDALELAEFIGDGPDE